MYNAPHHRRANYAVKEITDKHMLIEDLGPWDEYPTVTNAVEVVVEELRGQLNGRKLFYVDSEGVVDEIVYDRDGKFSHFAPGRFK